MKAYNERWRTKVDQKARLVAALNRMPFDEDQRDVIMNSMTDIDEGEAKKLADELEEALNLIGEALDEWPLSDVND